MTRSVSTANTTLFSYATSNTMKKTENHCKLRGVRYTVGLVLQRRIQHYLRPFSLSSHLIEGLPVATGSARDPSVLKGRCSAGLKKQFGRIEENSEKASLQIPKTMIPRRESSPQRPLITV